MDGLLLDRDELLVLLNATEAQAVIGLDQAALFPATADELRRRVAAGHRKLAARGLLQQAPDGVFELPELLLMIATVLTQPDLAVISVRQTPGVGAQLFLHYVVGEFVVEQTLPSEGQHRLATLPNRAALVPRLQALFPIATAAVPAPPVTVAEPAFRALVDEANGDQAAAQARLAAAGMPAAPAATLVEALAAPLLSGSIALLRVRGATITGGRNPIMAIGPRAAWLFFQTSPGSPQIALGSIDTDQLGAHLDSWIAELALEPAS